jgi:hypothetical protein
MILNEDIYYLNGNLIQIQLIDNNDLHKYVINNDIINETFYELIYQMSLQILYLNFIFIIQKERKKEIPSLVGNISSFEIVFCIKVIA